MASRSARVLPGQPPVSSGAGTDVPRSAGRGQLVALAQTHMIRSWVKVGTAVGPRQGHHLAGGTRKWNSLLGP